MNDREQPPSSPPIHQHPPSTPPNPPASIKKYARWAPLLSPHRRLQLFARAISLMLVFIGTWGLFFDHILWIVPTNLPHALFLNLSPGLFGGWAIWQQRESLFLKVLIGVLLSLVSLALLPWTHAWFYQTFRMIWLSTLIEATLCVISILILFFSRERGVSF